MVKEEDKKFGELLLKKGILNKAQLLEVFNFKKHNNEELTQIITNKGLAEDEDVVDCLAELLNIPFIQLHDYAIDPAVLELVPKELSVKHKVFPVFKIEDCLTIAMVNPGDVQVIDRLHRETGYEIEPAVSLERDIIEAIETHYEGAKEFDSSLDEVIQNIESEKPKKDETTSAEKLKQLSAETPVVKLVNLVLSQAIMERASDIHIEPEEKTLQVRYRVDGLLHDSLTPPKHLQPAIISRIKILADLDIAESRTPQDGRFQIVINGREIDFRVSTLPTVYGENIVLRILDKSNLMLNLEDLGIEQDVYKKLQKMIDSSYGVILVSGPTGSGKTTTLYSILHALNKPDKNIITVEDPVEYRLKRIRQAQVNVKAGLTFAVGLRAILRQDPDILMVGEIRDSETAKIAIEAALTGHLVLSTIHTNDAPGGLTRLTEMGIEPFLSASAIIGIIAQRLVRKLCENCKMPYKPTASRLAQLRLTDVERSKDIEFYRAEGCFQCRNTGYKGRNGIYEIMVVDEEIRELTLNNASADQIKRAAIKNGMQNLRHDGLIKAMKGMTSLEEVLRVTNED